MENSFCSDVVHCSGDIDRVREIVLLGAAEIRVHDDVFDHVVGQLAPQFMSDVACHLDQIQSWFNVRLEFAFSIDCAEKIAIVDEPKCKVVERRNLVLT